MAVAVESTFFEHICCILDALEELLPTFIHQGAEQIFKRSPEVSTLLNRSQVRRLQQSLEQLGHQETRRILTALSDEQLWLLPPSRKRREHLHHNTRVWKTIRTLTEPVNQLLQDYGYTAQHGPQGLFFPELQLRRQQDLGVPNALRELDTHVLKYWVFLARFRQARQEHKQHQEADTARQLDALWNQP